MKRINKFPKLEFCEICGKKYDSYGKSKLEWSNKTGKLIKDRKNFICVYHSCHMKYDIDNKNLHEGIERF